MGEQEAEIIKFLESVLRNRLDALTEKKEYLIASYLDIKVCNLLSDHSSTVAENYIISEA